MAGARASDEAERDPIVALPTDLGLCERCRHSSVARSRRSAFLRCGLAEVDSRFPRYPRLPVLECAGYCRRDGEG